MSENETEILSWLDEVGPAHVEWEVPTWVADELRAGRMPDCKGVPAPVRYMGKAATDRLGDQIAVTRARQDQIRCRLDELVDEYPGFKSYSPRDDDDE